MKPTNEERFWSKVHKSEGCWEWQGGLNTYGYGRFFPSGTRKECYAHRYSYFLAHGALPALSVLHSCDNPKCVNPAHLSEGTQAENMRDAAKKGRIYRRTFVDTSGAPIYIGERHSQAKLTAANVIEIRQRSAAGESTRSLAKSYQVKRSAIWLIVKRRNWKHV